MTAIELRLGPRPDEPGPPIGAGPRAYSAEVTERLAADAAVVIAKYPHARSALLPLLHLVQAEDGFLTPAGIAFCANQLDLSAAEVTAVATFYSMYRRTPTGEYLVGVCTNTLCAVMGGDPSLDALADHRIARERGMTAPAVATAGPKADAPDDEAMTERAARDEPAPGPTAEVQSRNGGPE